MMIPAAGQTPERVDLSVNVNLVQLHITVRDRSGRAVAGLAASNFTVKEDGIRQLIRVFVPEDAPITVGLVIDHSGSVTRKIGQVTAAARAFVGASNPEDQLFVVNFNETVTFGLPATTLFSSSAVDLEAAIRNAPLRGKTALYDAVFAALQRLRDSPHDKKALVVVGDGADNASVHGLADVLRLAAELNALIYAIGIFELDDPDKNLSVLRMLARNTGAESFFPRPRQALSDICQRIAVEMRSQYTIGYISENRGSAGGFRAVRVEARLEGKEQLEVRTRTGYYVAPDIK